MNTLLKQKEPVEQFYTVKDLMSLWQKSERTIRGYYAEGAAPRLEPIYLGPKSVRFTLEAINNFENELNARAKQPGTCVFENDDGTPCKNNSINGTGFCYPHRGQHV